MSLEHIFFKKSFHTLDFFIISQTNRCMPIENDFPENTEIPLNLLHSLQSFQSIIDTKTGPISRNFVAK